MINARPYLDEAEVKDFDIVYHGTYWECAPRILATGVLSESNKNFDLGEREFHGVMGTYSSPNAFETLIGYGWPVNVFGNNCYYSIGFETMGYRPKLKKVPTYGICQHRKSVSRRGGDYIPRDSACQQIGGDRQMQGYVVRL